MIKAGEQVTLLRDCKAVTIPNGISVILNKGLEVVITQALGGSYTVNDHGRLYRVAGEDSDALGESLTVATTTSDAGSEEREVNFAEVFAQIRTCYDPEIPVNIVDLGLIYDVNCYQQLNGRNLLRITMTLTSFGCGMGTVIAEEVKNKCLKIANVDDVEVTLVFDPPWSYEMISDAAKLQLGLL